MKSEWSGLGNSHYSGNCVVAQEAVKYDSKKLQNLGGKYFHTDDRAM